LSVDLELDQVQRIQFDHRTDWTKTHHIRLDDGDGLCGHPRHPREQTERTA